ncbi:hypothetical protein [Actinosynnema sp. NPDC020468]|uniref:hypothetical protein n=1 Tax=Actinosynnema sp. NPDC020468 TaxID=3154488 RepID=UPI0033C0A824
MAEARWVGAADVDQHVEWLAHGDAGSGWVTGYDRSGWEDSTWVLHALWEWPVDGPPPTHHEQRQRLSALGLVAPVVVGGLDLDAVTVATGVPLGYAADPGAGWRRVRWTEWALRRGFALGGGRVVPPCHRWFPVDSWPANTRPPTEGSLDETSLRALLRVLARHSVGGGEAVCHAFYGAAVVDEWEHRVVLTGPLDAVPDLLEGDDGKAATPSCLWPADRSWFLHTDWDLWATRVGGSRGLIAELRAEPDLETREWSAPTA